jgi:outer membrane protein OmpA-like peptidoglycan-associated protein
MKLSATIRNGLIIAVAAVVTAGCHTTDAYTGEKKVSKTAKGAGIGALSGAILGAVTGDNSKERRERALIGAGVGALAGGAVGNYMDRQEAKLRAQLQGTGVSVTRSGNEIVLNMPGNVTFQTASADLNANFFGVLDSVAIVLKEFDKTLIDVEGHTDNVGADDYNLQLSQKRASTVAGYLRNRGVNDQRIVAEGAGEREPVASNDSPDGRQQNRRVELTLQPITQG